MATPVLLPRQGQSVESCILIEWSVSPGDQVDEGDVIAEIETDKASFEVEAPASGTIIELFFEPGADIPVLTNIAAIGDPGDDISALRPERSAGENEPVKEKGEPDASPSTPAAIPEVIAGFVSVGVSPRARGLAAANGIDVSMVTGTGPGGRVIERDIRAAIEAGTAIKTTQPDVSAPISVAEAGDYREEPLTGVRKIISDRMVASLATTAQLTLNRSFDVTSIQALRNTIKLNAELLGLPNITLNDMVVYATTQVLARHPELNAHHLGDRLRYFDPVHMGIAVDTPRGLMVPVVRNMQDLSLREISETIKPLAEAAQSGNINPDLLQGGTFTITNLGALGIESFTPILNAPEVAILGVCGIALRPVADDDGSVKHVPSMGLSLTINHQVVDGAPAARFLADLVNTLENFQDTLSL